MTDFPDLGLSSHLFLTSLMADVGIENRASLAATTNTLTWVANIAIYCPVTIPYAYPVKQVFWVNGGTLTSSNADFGIYTTDGTRIYSTGTTALSGTNGPQATTPTPFILGPGRYFFAYVCDNTTSRTYGLSAPTIPALRTMGVLQETLASASLPATATFAALANALFPLIGITRTTASF